LECGLLGHQFPLQIDQHVGARLRVGRIEFCLSQEALGERFGVSFHQIQKYERGAYRISASRLFVLANALLVPVQFFFDGLDDDGPQSAGSEDTDLYRFIASSAGVTLALAFSRIGNHEIRQRVIDLVHALAKQDGL
jgi:transcriptional regulator with XRE-family HTH domain